VADFDPRQLDQLEDALEQLEFVQDLDALELTPELSERLREYQDVLALCREAFPLESPDDAVLSEVLAEAREVSRRPRLLADQDRSTWRRFWERWRGTVVPGFALAATAAVVLWVINPAATDGELLTKAPAKQDERRAEPKPEPEPEQTQPASEHQLDEPESKLEPTPAVEPTPAGEPVAEAPEPEPESKPESKERPRAKKKSTAAKPVIEPKPEPLSKDDAWNSLARADSARRKGNCDHARSIYDEVIAASPSAQITAQAKAGIGLCLEQDRRDAEATNFYEQARRGNPAIDTWISQERDEQPMPGSKSKKSMPTPMQADEQSL
jgi:tetratricopeptide (TPR) repeat protein